MSSPHYYGIEPANIDAGPALDAFFGIELDRLFFLYEYNGVHWAVLDAKTTPFALLFVDRVGDKVLADTAGTTFLFYMGFIFITEVP